MARNNDEDMLMEDDIAAVFLDETTSIDEPEPEEVSEPEPVEEPSDEEGEDEWDNITDDFPGQLAVDVYETADRLVVKARTAGIKKSDLEVSVSDDGILTISGVLSGGEDEQTTRWHIQECYWGEFSRTIALPVEVRKEDDSVEAELKDGVLTISFEKVKNNSTRRVMIK